jgi:hypothetical protein
MTDSNQDVPEDGAVHPTGFFVTTVFLTPDLPELAIVTLPSETGYWTPMRRATAGLFMTNEPASAIEAISELVELEGSEWGAYARLPTPEESAGRNEVLKIVVMSLRLEAQADPAIYKEFIRKGPSLSESILNAPFPVMLRLRWRPQRGAPGAQSCLLHCAIGLTEKNMTCLEPPRI